MSLINCNDITVSFGEVTVLENIKLTVEDGDKIGLIARNGGGKTTLAHCIAGKSQPDTGSVSIRSGQTIGYLAQHDVISSDNTVYEEMKLAAVHILQMEKNLRALESKMADHYVDEEKYASLCSEYARLTERFEDMGGYELESRMTGILRGLGFTPDEFNQKAGLLSGGQQTRLALARILFTRPDILMLDEPTNHLDLNAVQWLTDYLKAYKGTLLLITHDRAMLDSICNKIAEIFNAHLTLYNGNYTAFREQKRVNRLTQERQYDKQQKYISKQQVIIDRYHAFNREKSVKAAESREKRLESLEKVDKPEDDEDDARITFQDTLTPNDVPLSISGLCFGFDKQLFNNAELTLHKYDRAIILGDNGTGKTTLFKLVVGQLQPQKGEIRIGNKMKSAYLEQQRVSQNAETTVLDELYNEYPKKSPAELRNILAAFLFRGDEVFKSMSVLSGGERARVELAKICLSDANMLLLDEPTNHLDIETREALEDALLDFKGVILAISHDRYFINKIATNVFVFENEAFTAYEGNYDAYINAIQPQTAEEPLNINKTEQYKKRKEEEKRKAAEKQSREQLKQLEQKIADTETLITELEKQLCDLHSQPLALRETVAKYEESKKHLSALYEQWYEISG